MNVTTLPATPFSNSIAAFTLVSARIKLNIGSFL